MAMICFKADSCKALTNKGAAVFQVISADEAMPRQITDGGGMNQGKDIADSELLDYISESITLSTSLADCGEQKSCAVTTAKRLRDFLGDAMVKDKGLCCQYIVACEPKGTPVTERAIPVAIFKTNTENMKLYIKKWCKISSDSKTSIRSIVDWSYYKRRLCSMIQKKITIPAAMQKVANPVPRVPHPSWLLKRVNEKEEKFRSHQQELEDMNGSMSRENKSAGADLEDMGKAGKSYVIAPRPIVHSHGVNKRVKDLVDKSG
ncbi:unnamed protein product [Cuscuta campestris]|uniref:DNA polymerase epsilon catalytic subunit n=1 Tax=Cuscuta campestris TaxID=132261 RepID=A0A484L5I5_9ASTE|nr:unnamed protein product [Cuscuta campestris]